MNIRTNITALLLSTLSFFSCKKDSDKKACWQVLDNLGNNMNVVCGKSESEMQSLYPNPCNYYKLDGDKFCWFVNGQYFVKDQTESYVIKSFECQGQVQPQIIKVPCDYCQKWFTRQKKTYKPTMTFQYTSILYEQFCGDTVRTLFQGREIILKETADSLIIVQFSNNGIF